MTGLTLGAACPRARARAGARAPPSRSSVFVPFVVSVSFLFFVFVPLFEKGRRKGIEVQIGLLADSGCSEDNYECTKLKKSKCKKWEYQEACPLTCSPECSRIRRLGTTCKDTADKCPTEEKKCKSKYEDDCCVCGGGEDVGDECFEQCADDCVEI